MQDLKHLHARKFLCTLTSLLHATEYLSVRTSHRRLRSFSMITLTDSGLHTQGS